MATNTQNAVALLNALYNFRKATVANPSITMPQALRDRSGWPQWPCGSCTAH